MNFIRIMYSAEENIFLDEDGFYLENPYYYVPEWVIDLFLEDVWSNLQHYYLHPWSTLISSNVTVVIYLDRGKED